MKNASRVMETVPEIKTYFMVIESARNEIKTKWEVILFYDPMKFKIYNNGFLLSRNRRHRRRQFCQFALEAKDVFIYFIVSTFRPLCSFFLHIGHIGTGLKNLAIFTFIRRHLDAVGFKK